jgi:hypothetical protein
MTNESKKSWLRPQFTLGALLLLITVCAPFLAYLSEVRKWNDRRNAAISAAPAKRIMLQPEFTFPGQVAVNPPKPSKEESAARKLWSTIVGKTDDSQFARIHIHDFYGKNRPHPPVTNEDLKSLEYLPEAEEFYFFGSDVITDEGFAVLGKLPKLKRIQLQKLSQVTGEFLDHLPAESPLETIRFIDIKGLDGTKLKSLGRLKNLKSIMFHDCPKLSDETLQNVDLPGRLTELRIDRTRIEDATLARWLEQVSLEELWLQTRVSRAILPGLAKQTNLQQLCMGNAPLVDEDFVFLKNCASLRQLQLNGMPLRGEMLDYVPIPDKVRILELNSTLIDDEKLPKLARFSGLSMLGLGYTPLTGEGFVDEVRFHVNTELFLCGAQFSEAGKVAFAKWNRLKSVSLPSNWTPADNKRFQSPNAPLRPSLNRIYLNAPNPSFPFDTYNPLRMSERIDNCPAELMKPVADLIALGIAEQEELRRQYEATQ